MSRFAWLTALGHVARVTPNQKGCADMKIPKLRFMIVGALAATVVALASLGTAAVLAEEHLVAEGNAKGDEPLARISLSKM